MNIAWFNPIKWIQWGLGVLRAGLSKILGEKAADVITEAIKVFLDTFAGRTTADIVTLVEALIGPGNGEQKFNAAVALLKRDLADAASEIKNGNYDTFVQLAWQGLESNLDALAKKYLAQNYDKVVEAAEFLGLPVPPKAS